MIGDIERVLAALGAAGARYLIVGGVAVVLHGHLRTTLDLDLVVQLEPDNVRRALAALGRLGYSPRAPVPAESFADPAMRATWVHDKGLRVFSLWSDTSRLEVDLFVEEPFDFEEADRGAVSVQLGSTTARVVSLADLIVMKQEAGRPRDEDDVRALRALGPPSE